MKRLLFMVGVLALLAINIYCGGNSSTNPWGITTVRINLGETRTASPEQGGILKQTSVVPSNVAAIRFTISAPDMVTIQKVVTVAGRTTIIETFEVPSGLNRLFVVEALDESGNILYRGETIVNLDGRLVTLRIVLEATQVEAPIDLYISNVVNNEIDLSFEVNNSGNVAANNVLVFIILGGAESQTCQSFSLTVPAGGSVSRTLYSIYASYYKIIVDPLNTISETNEENNVECNWAEEVCSAPPPTNCP